ncbi:MAG: magnesium chelatase [Actinomycetota bacterium]|jgi:magnesium chelatase subunit I|nr:magnesium chelatase [Actinomycetota bacterium]
MDKKAKTLGELRESGYASKPVKKEIRDNAIMRIESGTPLIEGVRGYEDTVLPALEVALISGHDVILLGERGQAKTKIIRSLVSLLDEWTPIVAGSELNDDPLSPTSRYARERVAELGDKTPVDWIHRFQRYSEKLATPDTSMADLIGEVDPIKVAEGRYLSDEFTLHYGLVPRTNRGIFAINELPDLAERIQVGLLNLLEERDVQIRGYKIRLDLDLMFLATANPEDYTNRGRLITPLKDRFGTQLRTHYPRNPEIEIEIMHQESSGLALGGDSYIPQFMSELVAEISQQARRSPSINQRSGVSVRMSVSNYETMVSSATRRSLIAGEQQAVPRISDLWALASSMAGKIEIDAFESDAEKELIPRLISTAVLNVFRQRFNVDQLRDLIGYFDSQQVVELGPTVASEDYASLAERIPGLAEAVRKLDDSSPGAVASSVELILEGLHCSKKLNKRVQSGKIGYFTKG